MIKYKLSEIAKNLNVPSKEISEVLKNYLNVSKKSAAVLTEQELNVIFEYYTDKTNMPDLNAYYASAAAPKEENKPAAPAKPEKKQKPAQKKQDAPKNAKKDQPQKKQNDKPAQNTKNNDKAASPAQKQSNNNNNNNNNNKPESFRDQKKNDKKQKKNKQPAVARPKQETQILSKKLEKNEEVTEDNSKVNENRGRVINTRASHVNIDKYNEKYDRLASEKMHKEPTSQKQKINQRSQQKGKPRNSRKETEAERLRRIAETRKAKPITVQIPDEITVGELALRLKATAAEVIKKLMMLGVMATINDVIDFDTASLAAMEFHAKIEKEVIETIEERIIDDSEDDDTNLVERAPVVVVMGHVDHGKTSLLDYIRKSKVAVGEAGGITQRIGAYHVETRNSGITFLDTPGHAAFTAMRARGAQCTDIVVLVVAADDGVMPQTLEAIQHAQAGKVPMIVAINKMDKPGAEPQRVINELMQHSVIPEEMGGENQFVQVSAKTGMGVDDLLEAITLQAEVLELKAVHDGMAEGVTIESRLDKGRGPVATVLVRSGTLHKGDTILCGLQYGRVRAMRNEKGQELNEAGPSIPVEVFGLSGVPSAGDEVTAVSDEKKAREVALFRQGKFRELKIAKQKSAQLASMFSENNASELKVVLKADTQGSVEAISDALIKLGNEEVQVKIIGSGVGGITANDATLAAADSAVVIGFNVRADGPARQVIDTESVDLHYYSVIYDLIDDVKKAMSGLLKKEVRENFIGYAEVRDVFRHPKFGAIAGCMVVEGMVKRSAPIRVLRDNTVIFEGELDSLRRFKDDVAEVKQNTECGICVKNYQDVRVGDRIEVFEKVEVARTLD